MAGEMLVTRCLLALMVVVPGLHASYPSAADEENAFHLRLKVDHSEESTGHQFPSQEFYQHHPVAEYQHPTVAQHSHYPAQQEQQHYLVQSGYNIETQSGHTVSSHPQHYPHQQHGVQRNSALPYNNQRLHVKVEHPGAAHGFSHPIVPSAQHLRQQLAQEPKKDYRASIPKSIAPKLNPLHHSFHQKRNFVPLHHITRQVPLPAGMAVPVQHHSHAQPQSVKVALSAPPPKHVSG
ncbi:uncharacterized protein LOC128730216 [Anopheles nili]|uniref:uncharacterized protein LOC128730216 n=1 Tax=Anopheles nili TaxID=185578 RepID=UPI00237AFF01|nr:uncharacterized protein LOC128730216 [Anopheles nili]